MYLFYFDYGEFLFVVSDFEETKGLKLDTLSSSHFWLYLFPG